VDIKSIVKTHTSLVKQNRVYYMRVLIRFRQFGIINVYEHKSL